MTVNGQNFEDNLLDLIARRQQQQMKKRTSKNSFDFILFIVTFILLGIGLIMVFSSSFVVSMELRGDSFHFLRQQAFGALLGLMGMLFFANYNYRNLKKHARGMLILSFVLLFLVFMPDIGKEINFARRWIGIGGISFQPAEFTKIALVLFIANFLSKKNVNMKDFKFTICPMILITSFCFFLILKQPDLGTAIVVLSSASIVLVIAGMRGKHIFALSLLGLPVLSYFVTAKEYRLTRLLSFVNPWEDAAGAGYQIIQSFYALGSGQLFGVGLGRSMQKLYYLPEPHSDFIFALIGEELGFIGATAVIFLFFVLIWRGFEIASNAPDKFGTLLSAGLISTIAIQAIINIGAATGSVPITGINLPLISAGGSSLFFILCSIGVILNISKYAKPATN